jgi:GlcNAc-P-P-Und epimerase
MKRAEIAVIFGGTGFIGSHLAQHLLRKDLAGRVVLVDSQPPRNESWTNGLQDGLRNGLIEFVQLDVRQPIPKSALPASADYVFNLAAVHREPGHEAREYFDTNIRGAENVCAWTSTTNCNRMVFTSSISPYGPTEDLKDEESLPVPETPYGSSKLAAEKVHIGWQSGSPERKLLILRPGVVFGPGEGGNVTRLVRSLVKGYFVYMGNRQTRKAGGYVKELGFVIQFGLKHQDCTGETVTLLNFGMSPPPPMEAYVNAIRKVTGIKRSPANVPRALLLGAAYPIEAVARTLRIKQPVSPIRVRKLFRSTSIDPKRLRELGYCWKFTLESAFSDWKSDVPHDFLP